MAGGEKWPVAICELPFGEGQGRQFDSNGIQFRQNVNRPSKYLKSCSIQNVKSWCLILIGWDLVSRISGGRNLYTNRRFTFYTRGIA